jgi:hypothetical protein
MKQVLLLLIRWHIFKRKSYWSAIQGNYNYGGSKLMKPFAIVWPRKWELKIRFHLCGRHRAKWILSALMPPGDNFHILQWYYLFPLLHRYETAIGGSFNMGVVLWGTKFDNFRPLLSNQMLFLHDLIIFFRIDQSIFCKKHFGSG